MVNNFFSEKFCTSSPASHDIHSHADGNNNIINWFTGGEHYGYHNLFHCMDYDYVTITLVILMGIGVFSGYLVIAYQWFKAAKEVPESDAKKALNDLKWVFIICAICGYLWVILETVWPAWRFYMIILFVLNIYTWRYVFRKDALDRIYMYLRDQNELVNKIEEQQLQIEKLKRSTKKL